MDAKTIELAKGLVDPNYVQAGKESLLADERAIRSVIAQRKLPETGLSDVSIEHFLLQLSMMDSNNNPAHAGAGEREGRVVSTLVKKKHFGMTHGIGRSGDLSADQPKAGGSSIMYKVTNFMVKNALQVAGTPLVTEALVVPMATGMTLSLLLRSISQSRPATAKYVIWPRIDQKTCLKCIGAAGFTAVPVELRLLQPSLVELNNKETKEKGEQKEEDDSLNTGGKETKVTLGNAGREGKKSPEGIRYYKQQCDSVAELPALMTDLKEKTIVWPKQDGGGGKTIIFTTTKEELLTLASSAELKSISQVLHSDMTLAQRNAAAQDFRRKTDFSVLIAMDVAARGLDLPQTDLVIQATSSLWTLEMVLPTFVSRARWLSRRGSCLLLYGKDDVSLVDRLEHEVSSGIPFGPLFNYPPTAITCGVGSRKASEGQQPQEGGDDQLQRQHRNPPDVTFLQSHTDDVQKAIESVGGADNVVCVLTTTSCFAPRLPDDVLSIGRLCHQLEVPHVVNNAYGVQSKAIMKRLNSAMDTKGCKSRVDAFVQSGDKNFLVPVGGAVIACGGDGKAVKAAAALYAGRASASPIQDIFITMLHLGKQGWCKLLEDRYEVLRYFQTQMASQVAVPLEEDVVLSPQGKNDISFVMTLKGLVVQDTGGATCNRGGEAWRHCGSDGGKLVAELGARLFHHCVTGPRVVAPLYSAGQGVKKISNLTFPLYGSHSAVVNCPVLVMACGVGMTKGEVDVFIQRLLQAYQELIKEFDERKKVMTM